MRTGILISLFCCLFSLPTVSAQFVDIEGTVQLFKTQTKSSTSVMGGYQTNTLNARNDNADSSSDAILIWLVDKDNNSSYADEDTELQILDQVDKQFQPRLMAVKAGDSVRIKNSDPLYHNVFSLSKTKRFDVGRRSPQDYQDVTFDTAGVVDVFCDIHSNMHAVIRVLPKQTVAWQKLKGSGKFIFKNIPKGDYSLYFFALNEQTQSLDINAVDTENIVLETIRLGAP